MKTIDLDTWPRKSHYDFFRSLANPHIHITSNVNVTHLVARLKARGVAIFNAVLFCIMQAVNDIPELRMRFRNDRVIEHDIVHASTTVPIDNQRFAFCGIRFVADWTEFNDRCWQAVEQAKHQTVLTEHIEESDQWIFLSCLPWMSFSALNNPNDGTDDCIPRISWGKYTPQGSDWVMPVALQVHHALVDGVHIGKFYELLADNLAALKI